MTKLFKKLNTFLEEYEKLKLKLIKQIKNGKASSDELRNFLTDFIDVSLYRDTEFYNEIIKLIDKNKDNEIIKLINKNNQ